MTSIEDIQSSMDKVMDFAKGEDRGLTQEELDKYEGLETELVLARKSAEAEKRNQAYKAPQSFNTLSPMGKHIKSRDSVEFAMDRYIRGDMSAAKELEGMEGEKNAKIISLSQPKGEEFAQTETTTGGGYLVPTVTQDVLVKITKAFGGISAQASHINTSHGAPINFPSIDDTGSTSAIAAINAAPGSGGADLAFTQVSLGAFKYAATGTGQAGLKVPKELLDDALIDVTGLVTEMLGVRLARKMAADYAQGTGTTMPVGLFDKTGDVLAPSGGLVQATAISQLETVVHTLDPSYVNENCVWIMNWATHGILNGFVDSTGRPLLQPNYTASLGAPPAYTLLGFPIVIDQGSPVFSATASTNPASVNESYLAFGDFNQAFLIRDVQGIGIAVDPYTAIGSNQVLYFGYARTDSVVRNRKAYVLSAGFHS